MQMFRARCAACHTVFDVIATPVPVDVFVRVAKHAACPMCGNHKGSTCAPARDLTEAERAERAGPLPEAASPPCHPLSTSTQETSP